MLAVSSLPAESFFIFFFLDATYNPVCASVNCKGTDSHPPACIQLSPHISAMQPRIWPGTLIRRPTSRNPNPPPPTQTHPHPHPHPSTPKQSPPPPPPPKHTPTLTPNHPPPHTAPHPPVCVRRCHRGRGAQWLAGSNVWPAHEHQPV